MNWQNNNILGTYKNHTNSAKLFEVTEVHIRWQHNSRARITENSAKGLGEVYGDLFLYS